MCFSGSLDYRSYIIKSKILSALQTKLSSGSLKMEKVILLHYLEVRNIFLSDFVTLIILTPLHKLSEVADMYPFCWSSVHITLRWIHHNVLIRALLKEMSFQPLFSWYNKRRLALHTSSNIENISHNMN